MPKLSSSMHTDTLRHAQALGQPLKDGLYGLQWGDPDKDSRLRTIRDLWLLPFVRAGDVAIEIGPGGGRWTRYMLGFERLYVVDYHKELLDELRKNFDRQNIVYVRNNGTDFPSIERNTVDFVFSFGVFVHLDVEIINDYLLNLKHVIKSDGNIVIQYSDKDKIAAKDPSFSENNPRVMRSIVERAGYEILEEDTTTLPHSSIMRFGLPRD